MNKQDARDFLSSLLNKTLRVVASDGRMFLGHFKCTDAVCPSLYGLSPRLLLTRKVSQDSNVILAETYEYRQPSAKEQADAKLAAGSDAASVRMNMTSRFLGLVVVPGEHIVKIEVEEFASQMKGPNPYTDGTMVA